MKVPVSICINRTQSCDCWAYQLSAFWPADGAVISAAAGMPVSASSAQRHACSTARGQSIGSSASFSSDSVYSRHPVRLVLQQNHAKRRWPAHSHCRHVNCSVSCSLSIAACRRCYGAAAALAALLAASPASADVEELFTRNCAGAPQRLHRPSCSMDHASCASRIMRHAPRSTAAHYAATVHLNAPACNMCTGCHAGGGNVIQAGAALSSGDLKKNGVDDPKALFDLVYKGKGR